MARGNAWRHGAMPCLLGLTLGYRCLQAASNWLLLFRRTKQHQTALGGWGQTAPCARCASATRRNPLMLAPAAEKASALVLFKTWLNDTLTAAIAAQHAARQWCITRQAAGHLAAGWYSSATRCPSLRLPHKLCMAGTRQQQKRRSIQMVITCRQGGVVLLCHLLAGTVDAVHDGPQLGVHLGRAGHGWA